MPPKKQIKIETEINEIMIVNNKKLNPYLELVNFSSRNIDQKKLGTILGIFEIKDLSDDSAYIVNFLASIAKKTYFASHQKTPEESFESTLAKINMSLAEIANHGNVNWIGKIDAVLCSIFENQISFSVSGDAKVLLLRNQKLMEISESLSPEDEAANPLKTFTDIASGKLELSDKLILTTDDISHIFTLEDIEKHAVSFNNEKFARFLKTALVNELDIAGTILVDTKEKIEETKKIIFKKEKEIIPEITEKNLFGSKAFEEKNHIPKQKKEENFPKPKKDKAETYTNKKTGHIYITDSGEDFDNPTENKFEEWMIIAKEKLSDFNFWLKETYFKRISYKIKKQLSSFFKKPEGSRINIEKRPEAKKYSPKNKSSFSQTFSQTKRISQITLRRFSNLKNNYHKNIDSQKNSPNQYPDKISRESFRDKITIFKNLFQKNLSRFFYFISPKISLLKKNFLEMDFKLKIITLIIIILIFIIPFLFFKNNRDSQPISVTQESAPTEDLKINPSAQSYKEASNLYQNADLIGAFIFDNLIFTVGKDKITEVGENKKDYPFPDNFKNAQFYSFMSDLNLLFLVNDKNQLISFSPISLRFNNDNINIDNDAKIEGIGSYLTYLYIVDSADKQIYRYPRAENGFGEKINWLQSDIDFNDITGLAIDGNLYLTKKNSVIKLFNRKTQNFELKKDDNSSTDGIFTNDDTTSIYILDNTNGELGKYDKDGNKQSFVSNQELTQTERFWVDEKNSIVYFTTEKGLFKISL